MAGRDAAAPATLPLSWNSKIVPENSAPSDRYTRCARAHMALRVTHREYSVCGGAAPAQHKKQRLPASSPLARASAPCVRESAREYRGAWTLWACVLGEQTHAVPMATSFSLSSLSPATFPSSCNSKIVPLHSGLSLNVTKEPTLIVGSPISLAARWRYDGENCTIRLRSLLLKNK